MPPDGKKKHRATPNVRERHRQFSRNGRKGFGCLCLLITGNTEVHFYAVHALDCIDPPRTSLPIPMVIGILLTPRHCGDLPGMAGMQVWSV